MDPAKYADLFLDESREHLTVINNQLLVLEGRPDATGSVDAIFRAVHNLKGMSATMGFSDVARLSHAIENVLDLVRASPDPPDQELLQLLFQSSDRLEQCIDDAVNGRESTDVNQAIAVLDELAGSFEPADAETEVQPPESPSAAPAGTRRVEVRIRREALLRGARAALVLQRVAALGNVLAVSPPQASMETQAFDGRFSFGLQTDQSDLEIEELIKGAGDVESVTIAEVGTDTKESTAARHVRVDLRRLDAIMNLVGELTTAKAGLMELAAGSADPTFETMTRKVSHLVEGLQHEVIQARMAPVSQVFDRFPRGVRDAAREHGKQVVLAIEGREIELDRAILDELSDPLLHLLRNAIDHGIEAPEERVASGKPAVGRITLSAHRERAMIVIRVRDDGRGVDRDRILRKAKERQIPGQNADNLKTEELLELLAQPGFSTASSVSDLSGRGVPTLAILPALVAEVENERYAIPLTHVAETVDLDACSTTRDGETDRLTVRHGTVPLSRLRDLVQLGGTGPTRQPVIIVQVGDRRTGLVVDRVVGQQDIVARAFDMPRGTAPFFAGATVLGEGEPVLILDAARLV